MGLFDILASFLESGDKNAKRWIDRYERNHDLTDEQKRRLDEERDRLDADLEEIKRIRREREK